MQHVSSLIQIYYFSCFREHHSIQTISRSISYRGLLLNEFATLGHLDHESRLEHLFEDRLQEKTIASPEVNTRGIKGNFLILRITEQQMMGLPIDSVVGVKRNRMSI